MAAWTANFAFLFSRNAPRACTLCTCVVLLLVLEYISAAAASVYDVGACNHITIRSSFMNAIYVHKGEDATPPTYAMDERKKKALRQYHLELRTGITVSHFLPVLHIHAGGFLTDVESASIADKSDNLEQVDELINVLLRKENKDFDYFCDVLERNGCEVWSRKLKVAAGLGKQPQLYCY